MTALENPVPGAKRTEVGGLIVDEVAAGIGRVKRVIYPPGWRWENDMPSITGTELCQHAHLGFIVQGTMVVKFSDGCEISYTAPGAVIVEPDHGGWVVGEESVVLIQVDAGHDTVDRLELESVQHTCS